jgi:hypothetical protein
VIIPVVPSNNNSGRGNAFWRSAKERESIEWQLTAKGFRRKPYDKCVDVILTRILGPRQSLWDADSVLRGNAKELMDSLVALGWFHDDGPKYIRHCDGRQDATRRDLGPCWEIEVCEFEL